jgi:hypothetical protein
MSPQTSTLERYVASFEKFNDMCAIELLDPVAWQLSVGECDQHGFKTWRPTRTSTPESCLEEIYRRLPAKFPPLFEKLVLSYRWAEVDLHSYRLLANPPGPGLAGLFHEMSRDPNLWEALLPAGFVRFAKGPDMDYDPVCFDIKSRTKSGDCAIVKIDHEEILCNYRVKVVASLAPTFEDLMLQTLHHAAM